MELYAEKREGTNEKNRALRSIAPAYAGRKSVLTAALQYIHQVISLGASGMEREGRALERIAGDKLRHLEELGSLIARFGAQPLFTACPPYPVSYYSANAVEYCKTYEGMLRADVGMERALCVTYTTMLKTLEDDGAKKVVGRIAEETREHLKTVERMASEI